jgi:hypothetical protein
MEIDWSAPATPEEAAEADHCGHPGEELVHNPFTAEVYSTIRWEWMCKSCQFEAAQDV